MFLFTFILFTFMLFAFTHFTFMLFTFILFNFTCSSSHRDCLPDSRWHRQAVQR